MVVNENDIERYADVYFRGFEVDIKDKKLENMKKVNNMNYYVKLYMEFSAEIIYS